MPGDGSCLYHARRAYFAPWIAALGAGGKWWRRRVLPPGPQRLFHKPCIAIVGCPTPEDIGRRARERNPVAGCLLLERAT